MSYRVRFARAAEQDLRQLYAFLLEHDLVSARRALEMIKKSIETLEQFPFSCRKVDDENPLLRELLIPFGAAGYVALFKIVDSERITVLAVRHQREDDYH